MEVRKEVLLVGGCALMDHVVGTYILEELAVAPKLSCADFCFELC
jgi:hypothetical protein